MRVVIDDDGRHCLECGIWKPWDRFYAYRDGTNGKRPRCIECSREVGRRDYWRRPEERREQKLEYDRKRGLRQP